MTAGLLLSYLAFGALGASLSRRAGGGIAARLAAGIFPLALHVSVFVTVVVAAMLGDRRNQLRAALIFIVIPGVALAVGTLPFLRDGAKTRASA
jgi:nitrate/nitrite transporter NarK